MKRRPLYMRCICLFCKKVIYTKGDLTHFGTDANRDRDVIRFLLSKNLLTESKLKTHLKYCELYIANAKSNKEYFCDFVTYSPKIYTESLLEKEVGKK